MKPQDKALHLFRIFVIKTKGWSENEYTLSKTIEQLREQLFQSEWFTPKEMAIACVDEIIESIKMFVLFPETYHSVNKYWNEVRECLVNL